MQAYLEPEQWKLELVYWFAMAFARLQLEIFNTIEKLSGVDESIAYNQWEDTELKWLRGRVKLYSPYHTTLSTVGIIVTLVVVALLSIRSIVDIVLREIPAKWRNKIVKKWDKLKVSHLLEDTEKR